MSIRDYPKTYFRGFRKNVQHEMAMALFDFRLDF